MKRKRTVIITAAALFVVAGIVRAANKEAAAGDVPPQAAGWYGAMSLYRAVAVWAGERALTAENRYWKAVG